MAGLFDDLIPKAPSQQPTGQIPAAGKGVSFDDLIPPNQFDQKYGRMSHAQMADAYHTVPNGPEEQYLRTKLSQPLTGETHDQTQQRLGGAPMAGSSPWMSAGMGAADTLQFGFGDEINAGLRAATGQNYNDELEKNRYTMKVLQQDNPKSYLAGQVAGAVVPAIATMGTSTPGAGGSIVGTMARASTAGAKGGAVYGYGSGEGSTFDRLVNAGKQSMAGGVMGPLGVAAGAVTGSVWRSVAGKLMNRGVDPKAANVIIEQLKAAGHTPDSAEAALARLGPEAMLADTNPVFAAQTARGTNEAGTTLTKPLRDRMDAAPGRVKQSLDNAFGQYQDPYAFRQDIGAGKAQINPQYTAAINNHNTMMPSSLAELDPKLANMSANMSAGNRSAMASHVAEIDDALASTTPQQQAQRLLDFRHRLDDQIIYDPRQAATLSVADRASQGVNKQARAMVDGILKNNVPGIAEADAAHAPLSQQRSAFDYGRKQMYQGGTGAISQAENNARLLGMTDPERLATASGARASLEQKVVNQNADPGHSIDNILSRDWNMPKTEQLVGKPAAQKLANALQAEDTYTETSNLVDPSRGSRTNTTVSNANPFNPEAAKPSLLKEMAIGGYVGKEGGPAGVVAGMSIPVIKRLKDALSSHANDPELINSIAKKIVAQGDARTKLVAALNDQIDKNAWLSTSAQNVSRVGQAIGRPLATTGAKYLPAYAAARLQGNQQ